MKQIYKTYRKSLSNHYGDYIEWRNEKGQFHREDGPALEYVNGGKGWFINGNLHREDGPAIERDDGTKFWYLKGNQVTREDVVKPQREKLRPIMRVVFKYHLKLSVIHSRGLLKDLLPLIVNETYQ